MGVCVWNNISYYKVLNHVIVLSVLKPVLSFKMWMNNFQVEPLWIDIVAVDIQVTWWQSLDSVMNQLQAQLQIDNQLIITLLIEIKS